MMAEPKPKVQTKKEKKKKTSKELSAIAQKAIATRRQIHPEWGLKTREKEAMKQKKEDK